MGVGKSNSVFRGLGYPGSLKRIREGVLRHCRRQPVHWAEPVLDARACAAPGQGSRLGLT